MPISQSPGHRQSVRYYYTKPKINGPNAIQQQNVGKNGWSLFLLVLTFFFLKIKQKLD